jgi:hypothetical protein
MYPQMNANQDNESAEPGLLAMFFGDDLMFDLRSRLKLLGSAVMWFVLANLMSLCAIWVSHNKSMPEVADGTTRWADLGASAVLAIVFALATPMTDQPNRWRWVAAFGALFALIVNIVFGGREAMLVFYIWEAALIAGAALRPVGRMILRRAMRSERIQITLALLLFFWMIMTPSRKQRTL